MAENLPKPIQVNLFDFNFRQSSCSTAHQESQSIEYVRDVVGYDGITFFTDGYINDGSVDRANSLVNIAWLREPYCLHPDIYELAKMNARRFHLVLTYYEPFLRLGHPFHFVPYGGVWIPRSDWAMHPKKRLCSILVGDKMSTRGHIIRREALDLVRAKRMNAEVDVFGTFGKPVDYGPQTKFEVLADYAFSIITETCIEENLFTEWLLDCFAVGTIPIYWGCPNYERFFNPKGILWWPDIPTLSNHLDRLSMRYYEALQPYAQSNMAIFPQYAVTEDWIFDNIIRNIVIE